MPRALSILLCGLALSSPALSQTAVNRADYTDRLRAMWLAECIGDWTGLRTEGARTQPPFFTDADWNTTPPGLTFPISFVLNQDPWDSDDNTDIEYVDLHMMHEQGRPLLTASEIAAGWLLHMNPNYIWNSNYRAWQLFTRGCKPPITGTPLCNDHWCFISAQLSTEFFGALAPGLPDQALKIGNLPLRATASGFSAHACQFYILLHAYTPLVPANLPPRDQIVWLIQHARAWIPDTSKAADTIDFVLADFLANPDPTDWTLTRDRIYDRYQLHAAANGFLYRSWAESPINLAAGVLSLLYGQGNLRRTIQIATLAGWDSDDQAATCAAILGLLLGYNAVAASFPEQPAFSDRYTFAATRNNLPDYLPADPYAEDTFTLMAQRMLPLIDAIVTAAGGTVLPDRWVLPPPLSTPPLESNPLQIDERRSANAQVLASGGHITCTSSAPPNPPGVPWINGTSDASFFANAFETDNSGRDQQDARAYFFTTQGSGQAPGTLQTLTVEYDRPIRASTIRFIEGDHFATGGWFQSLALELKIDNQWTLVTISPSDPLDPAAPFQILDFVLPAPLTITGIRCSGPSGGSEGFITCAEIDAIAAPCYANCDNSTTPPILNILDFTCFLNRFAAGDPSANCDGSTTAPILNILDFGCFLNAFAAGCP